jgi:lipid-binding SYLF domain-containing protein
MTNINSNSLVDGLTTVQKMILVFGGVYASLYIIALFLGVLANVAESGDITLGAGFNVTINALGVAANSALQAFTSPVAVIIQLVIVVVLIIVFALEGFKTGGSSSGGGLR